MEHKSLTTSGWFWGPIPLIPHSEAEAGESRKVQGQPGPHSSPRTARLRRETLSQRNKIHVHMIQLMRWCHGPYQVTSAPERGERHSTCWAYSFIPAQTNRRLPSWAIWQAPGAASRHPKPHMSLLPFSWGSIPYTKCFLTGNAWDSELGCFFFPKFEILVWILHVECSWSETVMLWVSFHS